MSIFWLSQGPVAELGPRVLFMCRPGLSERLPFLPLLAYSVRLSQMLFRNLLLDILWLLMSHHVRTWCDRLCARSALTGVGGSPTSFVARLRLRKVHPPCSYHTRQRVARLTTGYRKRMIWQYKDLIYPRLLTAIDSVCDGWPWRRLVVYTYQ